MNQPKPFAQIAPLLYQALVALKGDEKEYFRDLVNKPYQGLDSVSLMHAYGDLRSHLTLLRRDGVVDLKTYFSMVQEANALFMHSLGVC